MIPSSAKCPVQCVSVSAAAIHLVTFHSLGPVGALIHGSKVAGSGGVIHGSSDPRFL